jgi:serine/threonine protein kinase
LDFADILNDATILKVAETSITVCEQIGEGGFGKVFRGEWYQKSGELISVAIKKQRFTEGMDPEAIREFYLEIKFLVNLSHENVLNLVGVVPRPSDLEVWILTEFLGTYAATEELEEEGGKVVLRGLNRAVGPLSNS